jgi:hypothetical protein
MTLQEEVLVIEEVEGDEVDDGQEGDRHRAQDYHLQRTKIGPSI